MDMELTDFFADLYEGLQDLISDSRPAAIKAWDTASYDAYRIHPAYTEAENVFEEISYNAWEERWDAEPGWVDGEEMADVVEMANYDAEMLSDAASAWSMARYNNNK